MSCILMLQNATKTTLNEKKKSFQTNKSRAGLMHLSFAVTRLRAIHI